MTLTPKTLWSYTENVVQKYLFLVIDTILPTDNPLRFCKNLLEKV